MKKISIILLLVITSIALGNNLEKTYQNEEKYSTFRIEDIKSKGNLIVALGSFTSIYSNDGGKTWTEFYIGSQHIECCISIVNDSVFYLSGYEGEIVKYDIKRKQYYDRSIPNEDMVQSLHFFDEQNGIASTRKGHIYKTQDGGESWKEIFDIKRYELFRICMLNKEKGYAVGVIWEKNHSDFYSTSDGGNTWNIVAKIPNEMVMDIYCFDDDIWLIGKKGFICKTSDEGKSWQWFSRKLNEEIYSISKVGNDIYFVYGDNSQKLLKTSDYFNSWEDISKDDEEYFRICYANSDYLFVAKHVERAIYRMNLK